MDPFGRSKRRAKHQFARATGIPTTRSGRRRKASRLRTKVLGVVVAVVVVLSFFADRNDRTPTSKPELEVSTTAPGRVEIRSEPRELKPKPITVQPKRDGQPISHVIVDRKGQRWLVKDGRFYGPDGQGFVCDLQPDTQQWKCERQAAQ